MSDVPIPERVIEAGARALRYEESSGMCELGRVCALCDCIDPKTGDEYARLHARKVLEAGFKELGLEESRELGAFRVPLRRYVTQYERIKEDPNA